MKNNNCAVIVSSFDGYSDIWDPFFKLFFRYWSDCPFPIYLITNELEYLDPRIFSFKVGKDKGWSSNLINILNKIDCKYIIYLQEDYFLNGKAKNKEIINALRIVEKESAVYLRLSPKKEGISWKNYESIKLIPKEASYLNSTQAAIWNKEVLLSILKEGETGWEFELKGGIERAKKLKEPFLCSKENILPYFATAIVKGKFLPGAIKLCKKENIEIKSKRKVEGYFHLYLRRNKIFQKIIKKLKHS